MFVSPKCQSVVVVMFLLISRLVSYSFQYVVAPRFKTHVVDQSADLVYESARLKADTSVGLRASMHLN